MDPRSGITGSGVLARYPAAGAACAGILILLFICLQAQASPLTVIVTADPATLEQGGSSTVDVVAAYEQIVTFSDSGSSMITTPCRDAAVTLSSPASGIAIIPASGTTDSNGRFSATLTASAQVAGTVTVYAVVQDSQASAAGTTTVTIQEPSSPVSSVPVSNRPPVAGISVDPYAGDAPLTVQFDGRQSFDPDGSVSGYEWSYGDGTTGSGYSSSHVYQVPGTYSASLVVTDDEGLPSPPASVGISVFDLTVQTSTILPVAIIEVNRSYGPAPLAVAYDGSKSSPSERITDWQWDFGDGTSARGPSVIHTYADTGSYDARLTVTENGNAVSIPSMIRIIAEPPLLDLEGTGAPRATNPAIERGTAITSSLQDPDRPPLLPGSLGPIAGITAGILIGAAGAVTGRTRPGDPGKRRIQEFIKNVTEKKGVAALAEWEKRKIRPVINRRIAVFAGLSVAEIVVALTSAVLVGSAFYLMYPDPGHLLSVLTMFILVAGVSVVIHDLTRRWVSRRQGRTTEYQLWPLGTIVMFLTAWLFACPCGKPSRPVSEAAPGTDPRQTAFECLAGPAASVILACCCVLLILTGGYGRTIGIAGISINIALAFYSLIPFEPMEGRKVWTWNRAAYLGIIIPLLVTYLMIAYLFS